MYPKDAEGTPGPASAHQISEARDDGGLADAAEPPVLQPVVSDGRYRGEFERGHWHGKGLLVHLNGDIYDGHFHYDVKHGAGTYVVAATGSVFVGEWVNGEPEGDAEVTFQNGEKYSGQVARGGVFQGKGTYAWPDGARYDGEWLEGLMHGQGRYLYANGDVYEGGFRRDQRHGVGRLVEGGGGAFAGVFDVMFEYGQMVAYSKAGQGVSTLVDRKVVHAQRTAILQREVMYHTCIDVYTSMLHTHTRARAHTHTHRTHARTHTHTHTHTHCTALLQRQLCHVRVGSALYMSESVLVVVDKSLVA